MSFLIQRGFQFCSMLHLDLIDREQPMAALIVDDGNFKCVVDESRVILVEVQVIESKRDFRRSGWDYKGGSDSSGEGITFRY